MLYDDALRLLLSHFRLRSQPILYFVPIIAPALLVQFLSAATNLLLQV